MRVHFIAIGGAAMHNLAIALSKKGFLVTGSDDVINEPSKSRLAKQHILPVEQGWHPEKVTADIDAVILGMHALVNNPELVKAQNLGLKVYSYPEYIYEQSKNKRRVVIGGSHGKTTITSMILHVLNFFHKEFDYLVGAQLSGFDTMVQLTDAPVIIIEGDEYLASPIDRRPKFHLYKADIGVISGIAWDHINVFPTFETYIDQFRIFAETVNREGTLIYCKEDTLVSQVVSTLKSPLKKIGYGIPEHSIRNGKTVINKNGGETELSIFGDHNLLNLNAALMVCNELGIKESDFNLAIKTFQGAARRLELLNSNNNSAVYKDFAHSPSKLEATIYAVKNQYPDRQLVAVIELHTFSSLNKDFLSQYKGTLNKADLPIVFISKQTFLQKNILPFTENDVISAFGNEKVKFFNNIETLERFLLNINYQSKNLLLMSSGNFGGMDLNKIAITIID